MPTVQMSVEDYLSLLERVQAARETVQEVVEVTQPIAKKAKKKVSSYNRKYKAAFKKVKGKYMTKAGNWKKGGFKAAVKAAHKAVKR